MPSNYTPQPGTIAARAVQHLIEQQREMSSAELLEGLGQTDTNGIHAYMRSAVDHGLVLMRREGRLSFWRVPGVEPVLRAQIVTAATHERPPEVNQAAELEAAWSGKPAPAAAVPDNEQEQEQGPDDRLQRGRPFTDMGLALVTGDARIAPDSAEGFDCSLSVRGRLLIEDGDERVHLSVEKTRRLLAYLDRIRVETSEGITS